ncbi:MAG: hypothetical protein WCL71_01540, partial [Deltaproteobacteria bacterium]
ATRHNTTDNTGQHSTEQPISSVGAHAMRPQFTTAALMNLSSSPQREDLGRYGLVFQRCFSGCMPEERRFCVWGLEGITDRGWSTTELHGR